MPGPARFSSTKALIWGTIGLNTYVFFRWNSLPAEPNETPQQRDRRQAAHRRYMYENYTLSRQNIAEGRWWTALTSAFSHQSFVHFGINMMVFHNAANLGAVVGLGPYRLAALALGSALAGSLGSLYDGASRSPDLPAQGPTASLGASGMVQGLLVATAMCVPHIRATVFPIPVAVPYWVLVGGFVAWDMWKLSTARREGNTKNWMGAYVGYAAHLGGAAFGAAFYMLALRYPFGARFGGMFTRKYRLR